MGIFDPSLGIRVDLLNSEALKVSDSLADLLRPRKHKQQVPWRDVRSLLIERSRHLLVPAHLQSLHNRMRELLLGGGEGNLDLTWQIGRAASVSLTPSIIDGLDENGEETLAIEQAERYRTLLTPIAERIPLRRRVANFRLSRRATRVIRQQLRQRVDGSAATRDDFAQALLAFVDQLGVGRVTYLVTTLLTAVSGAPGSTAACLLYAMHQYPEWRDRIRVEMAALAADEIYALPMRKLPSTIRFIKEAMRLWAFPMVTRRIAARDLEVDDLMLKAGEPYELSSYALHHSHEYWDAPDTFDPKRWLPSRSPPMKGTYVPFGFGARTCVGASLGHAQLVLFCELFAHTLDFEIAPESAPWIRLDGFAVPADFVGKLRPALQA